MYNTGVVVGALITWDFGPDKINGAASPTRQTFHWSTQRRGLGANTATHTSMPSQYSWNGISVIHNTAETEPVSFTIQLKRNQCHSQYSWNGISVIHNTAETEPVSFTIQLKRNQCHSQYSCNGTSVIHNTAETEPVSFKIQLKRNQHHHNTAMTSTMPLQYSWNVISAIPIQLKRNQCNHNTAET
jgi:hypothetical protein